MIISRMTQSILWLATRLGAFAALFAAGAFGQTKVILPAATSSHVSQELTAIYDARHTPSRQRASGHKDDPLLVFNATADKVLVRITADDIPALLPSLVALGFEVTGSAPKLYLVEGFLPVDALPQTETLGVAGSLGGVMAVLHPASGVGKVTSQGDFMHETNRVRAAQPTGYDGTGVRVGVMSDSYNVLGGANADIASNDLPPAANITILQEGPAGSEDEGRAMMQIVHDLAPGSPLAFSSVFTGEVNFAAQIRALSRTAGCRVLTDDIFYYAEPMFQDGVIAQAIDDVVTNDGVPYFALAGNLGSNGWETTTVQTAADTGGLSGNFIDFDSSAAVKTRQRLSIANNQQIIITVQWDNPFYTTSGVVTDIDAYLARTGTTTILASSANNNITNKTPSETLYYQNTSGSTQTCDLVFLLRTGPTPTRLKWVNFGANSYGAVTVLDFPKSTPTIIAHSAAVNARSVGAVNFYSQLVPASFTSMGPSTLLFNADGTRKSAPEVRQTPQMAAIQGVDTTFFGSDSDGNGFPNFFGTSAAAPTAAAIGALVRQANASFTPAQIYAVMQSTAADIGAVGFDNVSGYGLLNAWRAIFGSPIAATLPFDTGFETGGLTLPWETRNTIAGRLLVTNANSPADGAFHLTMDSCYNGQTSLNEATLHVNGSGNAPVYLVFTEREFSDSDDVMPTTFTGSSNSDGVAVSADGANWVRVADLTSANSTGANQQFQINLSQAASNSGITLGSDTRVKFQHYGSYGIASSGFAFDDIKVFQNAPAAPVLPDGTLPAGAVGTNYVAHVSANANPPATYQLTGSVPPGLTFYPDGTLSGTPTAPGVYNGIRVTASNGIGSDATGLFSVTIGNTVGNYATSYGLTGADAAPSADPDRDGLTNLAEYALNLSPTSFSAAPAAVLRDYSGVSYLSIQFTRVPLATDVTYIVEASADLAAWTTVAQSFGGATLTGPGVVSDDGSSGTHTVEVRDTVSSTAGQRRFLRLRFTQP